MLNKKAKGNQGENATLPPWGLCHLHFVDNGEKSNENKWVVRCCRALLFQGFWSTNDNDTSWTGLYWKKITRKKARAEGKHAEFACLPRAIREEEMARGKKIRLQSYISRCSVTLPDPAATLLTVKNICIHSFDCQVQSNEVKFQFSCISS